MINSAVEDDARSNPSANGGIENVPKAAGRAPASFSQGGGVRVIVDFHRHAIFGRDFVGERKISPARQVGRIQDNPSFWIEGTRGADPDALNRRVRLRKYGIDCARYSF